MDTFKAGNPDTPVTGIAVTMMATMDVLRRAAAQGDNLIITHEPTFFDHLDSPQGIDANDAVWTEKLAFIAKHGLVIWRFHDHWHRRTPDGIQAGMTRALGWAKYQDPTDPHLFKLPPTTLRKLADEVATKLLAGEAHEWETVEYAADAISQGRKKALILIGHVPSEQAGMEDCAQWPKSFIKDVPIEFVATQQPFWTTARHAPTH